MSHIKKTATISLAVIPVFILLLLVPYLSVTFYVLDSRGIFHLNFSFEIIFIISAFTTLLSIWFYQKIAFRISLMTNVISVINKVGHTTEPLPSHINLTSKEAGIQELIESIEQLSKKVYTSKHNLDESNSTLHTVLTRICALKSADIGSTELIYLFLELATDITHSQSGCIFLIDNAHQYSIHTKIGFEGISKDRLIRHAIPFLQWVEMESKAVIMPDTGTKKEAFFTLPLICFPLIYQKRYCGGIILSGGEEKHELTSDQIELTGSLSSQISYTIENSRFRENLERVYFETIANLAFAVEERDPYLKGHSQRVGEYAAKIGLAMGLSESALSTLRDASRLHDIGKTGITDSILEKSGPLNQEERSIIQRHPSISENIITPLKMFKHLLHPIRHHHERLDGSGYPDGLSESDISIETRILTVSDIFDALLSDRPHRKSFRIDDVRTELASLASGGRIDRTVVRNLFSLIEQGEISVPRAS